ncbi:MAG: SRPBCC domain-containing protein [Myxococcota bacterium]
MSGDPADSVQICVTVRVPPAVAFRAFTEEIDQWWRAGRRYRHLRVGALSLEPRLGGRLVESDGERTVQIGEVLAFEPPDRLLLSWRNATFAPDEATEVEVRFEPSGPDATMVRLVHRGWSAIRADHPARHGKPPRDFLRELGLWWGDLATSFRLHAR